MARGRDQHDVRQAALKALGRALSRRARSACELCGEGGPLDVVEVAGGPPEPEDDWAALLCARCAGALTARRPSPDLRFLETAMWSEQRPVQLLAVRLLRRLAEAGEGWARDALDALYLDPEVEALV